MSITIKLLAEQPEATPPLAQLWYDELGKQWIPNASVEKAQATYAAHVNRDIMPLTYVAFQQQQAVGMISLRDNDGIRPDLAPWIGSLIVAKAARRQGLGEKLIEVAKQHARQAGYDKLYLFALDPSLPAWYQRLGWQTIGMDKLYHHPVTVMETTI